MVEQINPDEPVGERMIDVFVRYLKAEGITMVFGIPGGLLHPFFSAVERDDHFSLIVARHEEGAAFMADGFARTSGRMAVCAGTSGPGATNLVTGIAVAFADGVPMLVVTGQAPSHAMGRGAAQEMTPEDIDIVSMLKPITKYSAMVGAPERLSHHLRRALRQALTGRPGPVHINVPVDFWLKPASERWYEPSSYRPVTAHFDRNAVSRAARALVEAKRPVILAGSGVTTSGGREHLQGLAELLPALVATTPRAKGVLPEDHPLSLGVMGFAGHQEAAEVLLTGEADVLLAVGASLNETTTLNWNPSLGQIGTLIQVDIDVDRVGRNYPVDIPVVGDAQTVLIELIYHIHRLIREDMPPQAQWADRLTPRRPRQYLNMDLRHSDQVPLTPQRWRVELDAVLADDAIIFSDIGGHMLFNLQHLCVRKDQRFVLNLGFGSMGHGTVAPIGAGLAHPGRQVVAIVGDACFTMNGMELITAAEYDVPVIWIVENNQMHGITWHGSATLGEPMNSVVNRRMLDVAALARAMGVVAHVVDKPGQLAAVFREVASQSRPALLEVRVDGRISPPLADRAKSIAGFRNE